MEHDNVDSPVKETTLNYTHEFFLDDFDFIVPTWEVYNYEEKKGIIERMIDLWTGHPNKHTFGQIQKVKSNDLSEEMDNIICENGTCDKIVLMLKFNNPFEGIHFYKRSSISILDYLANIAALGTSIFNGFCKVFVLIYSKNFDNYKIVENILSKEAKRTKIIELSDNNINDNSSISKLKKNLINTDIIDDKLYSDDNYSSKENMIINDIDIEENNTIEGENIKMITKLPKLRFFDFIFNNVYSKCCLYIKRQKLIDSCDEVLYNYYSIENILYNQIMFENLMKDYKWNNPELKSIHKNRFNKNLNKYLIDNS